MDGEHCYRTYCGAGKCDCGCRGCSEVMGRKMLGWEEIVKLPMTEQLKHLTCGIECPENEDTCVYWGDPYNTNGDCLAEK